MAKGVAFFISPHGDLITGVNRHIADVISSPEKFGLTSEYVNRIYKEHNEKLGGEGNAREEILVELIRNGWIRVREYAGRYWSIQVPRMSRKVKEYLWDFAVRVIEKKPPFHVANVHPYDVVRINDFSTGKTVQYTFKALAGDVLFTSSVLPIEGRSSLKIYNGIQSYSGCIQLREI